MTNSVKDTSYRDAAPVAPSFTVCVVNDRISSYILSDSKEFENADT
jgi:hypothetical protein